MRIGRVGPEFPARPQSTTPKGRLAEMPGKTDTDSQVLAVRPSAQDLELLREILRAENPLEYEVLTDPAEISRQMRIQLMEAADDDELESFGDATSWGELEGVPVEIQGFKVNPSTIEGGSGIYFVVFANRMDTGERVVLTTGSDAVMAQVYNLAKRGKIPGCIRILEVADKTTRSGYKPHRLVSTATEVEERKRARLAERNSG